ncbi:MAG: VCBS repeat-containing protein [Verrucomicrobiales bacterium]|nr:VCBS repeat-containing protein [Verrucomicrobiales bacterium]
MQTKASVRSLPVWQLSRAFSVAATILFWGAITLMADPPGPAQIRHQPAMAEPSVSLGVEVRLIAANHGGTEPFTYHWRRNGQEISGADVVGPRLNLGAVESTDAGEYTVLVRNAEGEALSAPFRLQVDPTFVSVPMDMGGSLFGAEWVDIDNDGWPDLSALVTRSSDVVWRIFRNSRDGAFVPVWEEQFSDYVPVHYRGYGDYDNDGLPDVAIGHDGSVPLCLYHNVGGGQLTRVWTGGGTYFHCEWADLDLDGYLDLVQLNAGGPTTVWINDHDGPPFRRALEANDPGFALRKITPSHYTAWGDYDDDGLMDLYVAATEGPGQLFRNLGAGQFELTAFRGPAGISLDAEWVDYDGDNDLDLVINFFFAPLLKVYRNDGGGQLVLMTEAEIGDLASDATRNSLAMSWGDYDNDGDLDLYRADGVWPGHGWTPGTGRLYVNQGGGRFVRVVAGSPTTGNHSYPYTACWADYNNDGFLDLIGGQERWQLRQIVRPGCGGTLVAHFGLGDAAKVDVLRVEWPSGVVQEYREVGVNQSLVIKEPPRLVPTGPCEFQVQCWLGMQFAVQASVDLKTWSSVGSVTNRNGTATFSDAVGVHGTCRFYRVVDE